jgi:hypothetical protein
MNSDGFNQSAEILTALFAGCAGKVELRALPSRSRKFTEPMKALDSHFLVDHWNEDLYFGVSTRGDSSNGTLNNCLQLPALFSDVDFKDAGEKEARTRLAEFPFKPGIVIGTGGGVHLYWPLNEPLELIAEVSRAYSVLRRLAAYIGADQAAAEPARVLRVPQTRNYKYDPPREVSVELFDPSRRYNVSEFEELLPSDAEKGHLVRHSFKLPPKVRLGQRNSTLYRLARSLRLKGLSPKAILAAVRIENHSRCEPPLSEFEVEQLTANALTQSDRLDMRLSEGSQIDVTVIDLKRVTGLTWSAIQRSNAEPSLFRYGDQPCRLEPDETGRLSIRLLTRDRMRHEAARRATWTRRTHSGLIPCPPPLVVVNDLLATPDPPLPILTRIVTVPVFTADGRLLATAGYDSKSGVYYAPGAVTVPRISESPSSQEVRLAADLLLNELLGDFPFVAPADKANALGLGLLHYCRDMIDGPTPNHLFEAPVAGSGKTLAVRALLFPAIGEDEGFLAMTNDDEEMRKRLTARFREARPANVIDNVTRPVNSGVLCAALTAMHWDDRILGVSESQTFPVRCIWAMTANNPTLTEELARRTAPIRLDPNQERPWLRENFKHPDLITWVKQNRASLIETYLTLIQGWVSAGCPPPTVKPLLSYEAWTRVIGGVLEHAGVSGFLENRYRFYEAVDIETEAWRELLRRWWERYKGTSVGTRELYPLAEDIEAINLGASSDERSRKTAFGMQLAKRRDQIIGPYRIENAGDSHRASQWRLLRVDGTEGQTLRT